MTENVERALELRAEAEWHGYYHAEDAHGTPVKAGETGKCPGCLRRSEVEFWVEVVMTEPMAEWLWKGRTAPATGEILKVCGECGDAFPEVVPAPEREGYYGPDGPRFSPDTCWICRPELAPDDATRKHAAEHAAACEAEWAEEFAELDGE